MDEFKKVFAAYDAALQKGISTSSLNGGTGSSTLTTRQDLDSVIVNLANRNTPFRDLAKRTQGQGAAFTFDTASSVYASGDPSSNPRDMVYADGGLPTARTTTYGTKIVSYVALGYSGSVTGLAQATGESLVDLYAAEVEKGTRAVIQGEEWLDFWGSTTTLSPVTNLAQYSGVDELITTNIVNAAGAAVSKRLIDQATRMIAERGGQATHIFASIQSAQNINALYNQYSQVIINGEDRQALTLGNMVKNVSTVAGVLDIVPDFFVNPSNTYPISTGASSTVDGNLTSTIFILAMPFIEVRDLKKLGMQELGVVADKRSFYVNEYSALKMTAEPWCAKITNVLDTIQS